MLEWLKGEKTYREKVVIVTGAFFTLFFLFFLFLWSLLCLAILDWGERLVFAISKLFDKHVLPLLTNDQIIINNLLDEARLVLQFPVVGIVDAKPVILEQHNQ